MKLSKLRDTAKRLVHDVAHSLSRGDFELIESYSRQLQLAAREAFEEEKRLLRLIHKQEELVNAAEAELECKQLLLTDLNDTWYSIDDKIDMLLEAHLEFIRVEDELAELSNAYKTK